MPDQAEYDLGELLDEVIRRREAEVHMVGEHEHYAATAALLERLRRALTATPGDKSPHHGADWAIAEARRLGLRVTFGADEVSESGGFGMVYADHDNDASKAFVALVEAAADNGSR